MAPSMQDTLFTGDRLIVNRLPVTWSNIQGTDYIPERGQIIVFKNPHFDSGESNIEYIVKRVVAFPGEHVVVGDGKITVYNDEYPDGFNFDDKYPECCSSQPDGEKDTTVPEGSIFVAGDHRQGGYSYDSRNGLGFIPFEDIVGPVSFRILYHKCVVSSRSNFSSAISSSSDEYEMIIWLFVTTHRLLDDR